MSDRFAEILKKWEQQSAQDLNDITSKKLDFLNKVDEFGSVQEMQRELNAEAVREWDELPWKQKLLRIGH
jgi:hypothetical protein